MADEQDDQITEESARGLRAKLAAESAENARLKAEFEAYKATQAREQAFAKAGIPDSKLGELFRKAYDGENTPEAIRAAALAAEVIQPERATPQNERDQILSLQAEQPAPRPGGDVSYIDELAKKIADPNDTKMYDSEYITELLRSNRLMAN